MLNFNENEITQQVIQNQQLQQNQERFGEITTDVTTGVVETASVGAKFIESLSEVVTRGIFNPLDFLS